MSTTCVAIVCVVCSIEACLVDVVCDVYCRTPGTREAPLRSIPMGRHGTSPAPLADCGVTAMSGLGIAGSRSAPPFPIRVQVEAREHCGAAREGKCFAG